MMSVGTLPLRLSARNSGDRCCPFMNATTSKAYGHPISSSAINGTRAQVSGAKYSLSSCVTLPPFRLISPVRHWQSGNRTPEGGYGAGAQAAQIDGREVRSTKGDTREPGTYRASASHQDVEVDGIPGGEGGLELSGRGGITILEKAQNVSLWGNRD